jgi:hypothetical protein
VLVAIVLGLGYWLYGPKGFLRTLEAATRLLALLALGPTL